jgi:hypothetical protein
MRGLQCNAQSAVEISRALFHEASRLAAKRDWRERFSRKTVKGAMKNEACSLWGHGCGKAGPD